MRRLPIATVILGLGLLAACSMWKGEGKSWSSATSGEQFERLWWEDIKAKRFDDLERRTAATFVGVLAGGVVDRAGLMQHLRQLDLKDYTLGDFVTQLNGADLVVAYRATFTLAGQAAEQRVRCLSVWQQTEHGWVLIARSITPDAKE